MNLEPVLLVPNFCLFSFSWFHGKIGKKATWDDSRNVRDAALIDSVTSGGFALHCCTWSCSSSIFFVFLFYGKYIVLYLPCFLPFFAAFLSPCSSLVYCPELYSTDILFTVVWALVSFYWTVVILFSQISPSFLFFSSFPFLSDIYWTKNPSYNNDCTGSVNVNLVIVV